MHSFVEIYNGIIAPVTLAASSMAYSGACLFTMSKLSIRSMTPQSKVHLGHWLHSHN